MHLPQHSAQPRSAPEECQPAGTWRFPSNPGPHAGRQTAFGESRKRCLVSCVNRQLNGSLARNGVMGNLTRYARKQAYFNAYGEMRGGCNEGKTRLPNRDKNDANAETRICVSRRREGDFAPDCYSCARPPSAVADISGRISRSAGLVRYRLRYSRCAASSGKCSSAR